MDTTWQGNIRAWSKSPKLKFWASLGLVYLAVSLWTLTRFFDQAANFDQLGQFTLSHQWLHGQHAGSVVGPTNYVLKMLFLYIPVDIIPISAQLKLVVLTLMINFITFGLLAYGLRLIWREINSDKHVDVYLPLIYLAMISGSVFWISFSNSRNLEVAGGVFLVYLYLKTQSQPSKLNFALATVLGGLLFFADPLQIYMTMLPALLFVIWRWFSNRKKFRQSVVINIFLSIGAGVLLSKILVKLVERVWNISFINNGLSPGLRLPAIKSAFEQMAHLYAGGYEGGRAREVINILVVIAVVFVSVCLAWRKPKSRQILALCALFWLIDFVIYIISGQAEQADTNRYLIMTVPFFILALSTVLHFLPATKIRLCIVVAVLFFNGLSLGAAMAKAWSPDIKVNDHYSAVVAYLRSHDYRYAYASANTAIASDYLSRGEVDILPLGCDPDHVLKKISLFFDKAAFNISSQADQSKLVPVILDGESISITSTTCTIGQIATQLGPWQGLDKLSDGSSVLLYKADRFQSLRGF